MNLKRFERALLAFAYKEKETPLTPTTLAAATGLRLIEAKKHLDSLVKEGVLLLEFSTDDAPRYVLPDRGELRSETFRRSAWTWLKSALRTSPHESPGTIAGPLFLAAMFAMTCAVSAARVSDTRNRRRALDKTTILVQLTAEASDRQKADEP